MAQYTITQRATNTVQTGKGWSNVENAYDNNESTYASRSSASNSACHINGFNFDITKIAIIDKIVVDFKVYLKGAASSYGIFDGHLYTDTGSHIASKRFINGVNVTTPTYYSLEVPASKIQEKLDSLGVYNNDIFEYLKSGVRVRWVGGSTSTAFDITCRVYDTKVTVYYTIPTYVSFDSIFSFAKWKDTGIISGNTATISNITDIGFSITANAPDSYTNNSHLFTVTPNTDYILEYDAVGSGHEAFVFCDGKVVAGRFWNTTNGVLRFTVPPDCTTIAIRCDSNVSGNTIDYSNIRIYPAGHDYMSNSVTAINRSCINSWSFPPTPTRVGYDFLGWNTKPDGSGTTYNSSSIFPTSDLVLYSQWKANKILIDTSKSKEIYLDTKKVKLVYIDTTKVYG